MEKIINLLADAGSDQQDVSMVEVLYEYTSPHPRSLLELWENYVASLGKG
jgi:hypothetical protein